MDMILDVHILFPHGPGSLHNYVPLGPTGSRQHAQSIASGVAKTAYMDCKICVRHRNILTFCFSKHWVGHVGNCV